MKTTAVVESLSYYKTNVLFQRILAYFKIYSTVWEIYTWNILNFGYEINFKYEGILLHSFEWFSVVTKLILPTINDLKFSPIDFDSECNYLNVDLSRHRYVTKYPPNFKSFCKKIVPLVDFYKKQIDYYNQMIHKIITKEIPLILSNFPKNRKLLH